MKMQNLTKTDNYDQWECGRLGNKIRSFPTYNDLMESDYRGLLSVRYKGGFGEWADYNVPFDEVQKVIHRWVCEGAELDKITFNESAPDDRLLMQGELCRMDYCGWAMQWSDDKTKMRTALGGGNVHHTIGPGVWLILKQVMTPDSYADMHELFELFPDSVVEFSVYEMHVGDRRGRNTLIWEVRNY